jgi:hypothetical protein
MGYQPEYGHRLIREYSCEEELPYYRFVTQGTTSNSLKLAKNSSTILGITLPEIQDFAPRYGGIIKRKSYTKGEYPDILHTGIGYIELAENINQGEQAQSGPDGKAIQYKKPTIDTKELKSEDIISFTGSIRDAHLIISGTIMDTGKIGDIVRIDLDRR